MNKTELKSFAVKARRILIKQVMTRAKLFGIDHQNDLIIDEKYGGLTVNNKTYPIHMLPAFRSLQKQLEQKGYEELIEEVAYTWFNRIIAIRYMEVHDYLPERVNVLSSLTDRVDPDILFEFEAMDLPVNKTEIRDLINAGDTEGAYRKLFIAQCNALNEILPFMFEKISDYTELLLPDFLLDSESVVRHTIRVSDKNYFNENEKNNAEILGWLYQYYMSEKKEEVGGLKNTSVKKEHLPIVTQLFTPHWIVKFMVQNSLGKIYHQTYPMTRLNTEWEYYFSNGSDLDKNRPRSNELEKLTILDPACGSGHILIYVFDMLYEMYEEQGYPAREIPKLILEKNIFGFEIDKRSTQIVKFTLAMKVMEKSRQALKKINFENVNVIELIDATDVNDENFKLLKASKSEISIYHEYAKTFANAKQFGSLIQIESFDLEHWIEKINALEQDSFDLIEHVYFDNLKNIVLPVLKQCKYLAQQYTVIVTNPPYHSQYNDSLKKFSNEYYNDYSSDLYSMFIKRGIDWVEENGYVAFMSPYTWLYISSHKHLRNYILNNATISTLVELEYSAFKDATVPICTFVLNKQMVNTFGNYIKLSDFKGEDVQSIKVQEAVKNSESTYRYYTSPSAYDNIEGKPITYWITSKSSQTFNSPQTFGNVASAKKGLDTNGESSAFIRYWFEVAYPDIYTSLTSKKQSKWFELNKGGGFRKWYGNNLDVINYENNGYLLKNKRKKANIRNESLYFKESLTYGVISSSKFSFRYSHNLSIFDQGGPNCFPEKENLDYILALGNSNVISHLLSFIAPTLNFTVGDINKLPVIFPRHETKLYIEKLARENLTISKSDWDVNEFSIDFDKHPFLKYKNLDCLSSIFEKWAEETSENYERIKKNEQDLNKLFVDIYNLADDVSTEISDADITIARANLTKDVRSFMSYFIGCVVGRYSLDIGGIAFAGGRFDNSKYTSFFPNKYGLIQFTDDAYFENDIIIRLREFLSVAFSPKTVEENINWLAEAFGMKKGESTEARLRRYFIDEFFVDHCKTYQRRPIYWLVDSGKQKGLRTLIYMHSYRPDTMATIRFEHLQEIQAKYNHEIDAIDKRLVNPNLSPIEKRNLDKQKTAFKQRLEELLEFDKKLAFYANAQSPINLDDGVLRNFANFDGIFKKIK